MLSVCLTYHDLFIFLDEYAKYPGRAQCPLTCTLRMATGSIRKNKAFFHVLLQAPYKSMQNPGKIIHRGFLITR
jgi:hypothetical protein